MGRRGNILLITLVAVGVLAASVGGYFWWQSSTEPRNKACTLEAKLCPDGSSVGRSGPNCEFTPCSSPVADSKTYIDPKYHFSITYPANWIKQDLSASDRYVVGFIDKLKKPLGPYYTISVKENWTTDQEINDINSGRPYTQTSGREKTLLAGHNAVKFIYSTAEGLTPQEIIIEKGGNAFIFNATPEDTDFWKAAESFKLF